MSLSQDTFLVHIPVSGALSAGDGVLRYQIPFDADCVEADATLDTAADRAVNLTVKVNGTGAADLVIGTGAHAATELVVQPGATPGTNVITTPYPDSVPVFSVEAGDYVTLDLVQVGSSTHGSNLVLVLAFVRK